MEESSKLDEIFDEIAKIMGEPPEREPGTEFFAHEVSPDLLDELLANGWRHFDVYFFRYRTAIYRGASQNVVPLRIRVRDFSLSKSNRRTLNRNRDLAVRIGPIAIERNAEALFNRHRTRFAENAPTSIYDYLSILDPAERPCPANQLCVYDGPRMVAASYFDLGKRSISSIYGMFDPELAGRRLGIFTILKEIEFARETGRQFYYLGYCYEGNSFYDYKKQFRGTESYDWKAGWKTFVPMPAETQNFDGHRSSNSRSANNVVIRHDHGRGRRRR